MLTFLCFVFRTTIFQRIGLLITCPIICFLTTSKETARLLAALPRVTTETVPTNLCRQTKGKSNQLTSGIVRKIEVDKDFDEQHEAKVHIFSFTTWSHLSSVGGLFSPNRLNQSSRLRIQHQTWQSCPARAACW